VTGFPPGTVTGNTDIADAAAANGQSILTAAYNDAAGRSSIPIGTELGGTTLPGGVYSAGFFSISAAPLTLDAQGDPNTVWIFQAGSTLTTVTGDVVLKNGALGCNVFWQLGSSATLGTGTTFYGNIMAKASITLTTLAEIPQGRALAETAAVTMDHNGIGGCACPP